MRYLFLFLLIATPVMAQGINWTEELIVQGVERYEPDVIPEPVIKVQTVDPCVTNDDGDRICTEGNVTYEYPSKATLDKRALKQAKEQAVINAKKASDAAIEKDKKDALEELIQERITEKKKKK
jgi:hypothetical protein